ncbi:MAG: Pycsar system effector family protein [Leptospirales bacterium]
MKENKKEKTSVKKKIIKEVKVSLDYMLRTTMQHHIQLSTMADQKANIMIGANAFIFSILISDLALAGPYWGFFSLCGTSIASLTFAILAVMPTYMNSKKQERMQMDKNLLFFGHFTQLSYEDYLEELDKVVYDDRMVFESMVNDLYQLGKVLKNRKYKYLSLSYSLFLYGITLSMILVFVQLSIH